MSRLGRVHLRPSSARERERERVDYRGSYVLARVCVRLHPRCPAYPITSSSVRRTDRAGNARARRKLLPCVPLPCASPTKIRSSSQMVHLGTQYRFGRHVDCSRRSTSSERIDAWTRTIVRIEGAENNLLFTAPLNRALGSERVVSSATPRKPRTARSSIFISLIKRGNTFEQRLCLTSRLKQPAYAADVFARPRRTSSPRRLATFDGNACVILPATRFT